MVANILKKPTSQLCLTMGLWQRSGPKLYEDIRVCSSSLRMLFPRCINHQRTLGMKKKDTPQTLSHTWGGCVEGEMKLWCAGLAVGAISVSIFGLSPGREVCVVLVGDVVHQCLCVLNSLFSINSARCVSVKSEHVAQETSVASLVEVLEQDLRSSPEHLHPGLVSLPAAPKLFCTVLAEEGAEVLRPCPEEWWVSISAHPRGWNWVTGMPGTSCLVQAGHIRDITTSNITRIADVLRDIVEQ